MKNVFIVTVEEQNGPERKFIAYECYASRTNAVKALKNYWDKEKQNWVKAFPWRSEDDFDFEFFVDNGCISYGWSSKSIWFSVKRLKILDSNK